MISKFVNFAMLFLNNLRILLTLFISRPIQCFLPDQNFCHVIFYKTSGYLPWARPEHTVSKISSSNGNKKAIANLLKKNIYSAAAVRRTSWGNMELTVEWYDEYEEEGADEAAVPQVALQQPSHYITYR